MLLRFVREAGSGGTRHAWLLHGILGSGQNLRSVARRLNAALPEWSFLLPDLRHHGESHGLLGPDTVDACVGDLLALGDSLGVVPETAIGHSFGGKVALRWGALSEAAGRPVSRVWGLDVPPGPPDLPAALSSEVVRVVGALRAVPMPLARREDIVTLLGKAGFSAGLGQWMTTNLKSTPDGYAWRFDLDRIDALLRDYATVDAWPWLEDPARAARVDLVRAGRSERWSAAEPARFVRPRLHLHTLADAGHWVHVDDPDGLHRLFIQHGVGADGA